ncbi:MAG: membrane protein insertase YidC [Labrys sp. (in: a-proteobacteria)]
MTDNKNMLLAIVLSAIVLLGWQYFIGIPQMERQRQAAQQAAQQSTVSTNATTPAPAGGATGPSVPGAAAPAVAAATRPDVIAQSPRVDIETPRFFGSIALKGGRIDDISLATFRETIKKDSPNITLLSPSGTPIRPANHRDVIENQGPFYADFGWVAQPGATVKLPGPDTIWSAPAGAKLTPTTPVTLTWDNGEGLIFSRTIAVDDKQMFSVTDAVENKGSAGVSLLPYALISRHGTPTVAGYWILHEGMIGVVGENGLQEWTYSAITKDGTQSWPGKGGWVGITEKYWAATVIPDQSLPYTARFSTGMLGNAPTYQTDLLFEARQIEPGGRAEIVNKVFAGAKEVALIDGYEAALQIDRFELLIDWGWFYFITKPLFLLIDWLYRFFGNFGVSILIVTVILKIVFFPLANKSYESMSKMKKVQPEMELIKQRFGDDKMKQQQELMALYKREKINPLSGCLPVLIQIPVFFALYKVLFVTIEMRHQPFFGWIQDLSAPDPTSIFNLFGLIPWTPPLILMLGVWPILMGITMFVQMQLNPQPQDPIQASLFRWMPILFTFMLASFPAGLVIYWTWNNLLSILQQAFIMRRFGVKIELLDNIKAMFGSKPKPQG